MQNIIMRKALYEVANRAKLNAYPQAVGDPLFSFDPSRTSSSSLASLF